MSLNEYFWIGAARDFLSLFEVGNIWMSKISKLNFERLKVVKHTDTLDGSYSVYGSATLACFEPFFFFTKGTKCER